MKKQVAIILSFIISCVLLSQPLNAQAPQKISYQAVIRNASNALVTNAPIGMQISILQGSTSGSVVYAETQTPNTNANGLVSLEIGTGAVVSGIFSTINWVNGPYFIKTETDPTGGTAYSISGTSELLSVPYALHAKTAESITGGITETDPVFIASPANGITTTNITNWNNKLDTEIDGSITNELQSLSISNDTIYLSNGGYTKLPAGFDGNYNSLTNKPTAVSSFSNDAGYLTSFTEVDGSTTNELQSLSISNDTIYLSNGGYTKLPAGFDGNYNSLTNKPTAVSSFSNDAGYLTSFTEVDGSITNELQTLRISNDTIYLSNGGFAKLPATNAWSLNGNAGTVNGTNFIGTTDNVPLNLKVNNVKAGKVDANSDVFLGYQAGSNSTAIENTAIGYQALQLTNNPLSLANTAIGYKALRANNGLGRNTAVGTHAMLNNTTGEWNTGVGAGSMLNNTTGTGNVAFGGSSLSSNQTGSGNASLGVNSLMNNIAGSNGVAVGYASQQNANNTSTSYDNTNTSLGYQSLMGSGSPAVNTGLNNTATGRESLKSNSTGSHNTATGYYSLFSNTTGMHNSAFGIYSLQNSTAGGYNTVMGSYAYRYNTTGNYNTIIGSQAGQSNTSGSRNVFIGYAAGYNEMGSNKLYIANDYPNPPLIYGDFATAKIGLGTITPTFKLEVTEDASFNGVRVGRGNGNISNNTSVGFSTLNSNTSGANNTAVGFKALELNASGGQNTAMGDNALAHNTSATGNTSIGYATLAENTTGNFNSALGYDALLYNTTGELNTALGAWAMHFNTIGKWNTALGFSSLQKNISGNNNTSIGKEAGFNNTAGSNNIFIGYQAGYNETGSNKLYIANSSTTTPLIYGDFTNGRVGIGTTSPTFKLEVTDDALFNGVRVGTGGGGNFQNAVLGYQALQSNTSGNFNTAIGYQVMYPNTTGVYNTAVGTAALGGNTTGGQNCAFGYASLVTRTSNTDNSAYGTNSLRYGTSGDRNSAFGSSALLNNGGNNNTAIGFQAGNSNYNGSGNVFLGYQAGYNEAGSNKLYIANSNTTTPLIYGDFATGNVGIGANNPTEKLLVVGNIGSGQIATFDCQTCDDRLITLGQVLTDNGGYVKYKKSSNYTGIGVHGHTEQLIVNGAGNVGIGTTSPTAKLEVNGAIKRTGGTASQFLKADGSVDNNTYLTAIIEVADEFSATATQASFTLTQTPSTTSKVKMYINGVRISNTAYSVSGTTLTYVPANNGSYTLSAGDRIQFDYSY